VKTDVLEDAIDNPQVDAADTTLNPAKSRIALYAVCCGSRNVLGAGTRSRDFGHDPHHRQKIHCADAFNLKGASLAVPSSF